MRKLVRVLIVEDSITARTHLALVLRASSAFNIVGQAGTHAEALEAAAALRPDIISLDVFLPGGTAAELVRKLRQIAATPIVLVSSASRDTHEVFEALSAGALDFVHKPELSDRAGTATLVRVFKALAKVQPPSASERGAGASVDILAVGASTGGPDAVCQLLSALPPALPVSIVVAQHIAAGFEDGLARWLTDKTRLKVRVAADRDPLVPGEVLLGRAGYDIAVRPDRRIRMSPAPAQGFHPSVDALLASAAAFGPRAAGIVLTGIGSDGKLGARKLCDAGGLIMAQDRATATVYGMPGAVARAGLATVIGPPAALARALVEAL